MKRGEIVIIYLCSAILLLALIACVIRAVVLQHGWIYTAAGAVLLVLSSRFTEYFGGILAEINRAKKSSSQNSAEHKIYWN